MEITEMDLETMRTNATQAASLLKGLANENRLMILCTLMQGEFSVSELNKRIPLSQSALSQHLSGLRKAGLVDRRRDGLAIYYSLKGDEAVRVIEVLHSIYCDSSE
jgi:DNA-binding transcriptional ArsR family regulator